MEGVLTRIVPPPPGPPGGQPQGPPPPPPPPQGPPPSEAAGPLTALRWPASRVWLLLLFAAVLNVGQALVLRALHVQSLPGEWPHAVTSAVVLAYYAIVLAPVWIGAKHEGIRFRDAIGLRAVPIGRLLGYAIVASFAGRFFTAFWVALAATLHIRLPGGNVDLTRIFGMTPFGIFLTVAVAVFIGPFSEEVLFRGVAYGRLRETSGEAIAVAASSLGFALLHFNLFFFVPFAFIGFAFTMAMRSTRSLATSMTAHALFNFVSVIALFALKARGG